MMAGLSPAQIYKLCTDTKERVRDIKGVLGFNNDHYWNMGSVIYSNLAMFDHDFDRKSNIFLGMDIRLNYNDPYGLEIIEKPKPQVCVNFNPITSSTLGNLQKAINNFKKGFEDMFTSLKYINIVKVIFNAPATIVIWSDGTKTVVKVQEGEAFDKEKGLAMAICKKSMGNEGNYYSEFKKWLED